MKKIEACFTLFSGRHADVFDWFVRTHLVSPIVPSTTIIEDPITEKLLAVRVHVATYSIVYVICQFVLDMFHGEREEARYQMAHQLGFIDRL